MDGHKTEGESAGSFVALNDLNTLYIGGHEYYDVSCSLQYLLSELGCLCKALSRLDVCR